MAVTTERGAMHENDDSSWEVATKCLSFTKESTYYFNSKKGTNVHLQCYYFRLYSI